MKSLKIVLLGIAFILFGGFCMSIMVNGNADGGFGTLLGVLGVVFMLLGLTLSIVGCCSGNNDNNNE